MLKRKAIINDVLVYIGIPSPEELYEIILDEFHPLDKERLKSVFLLLSIS